MAGNVVPRLSRGLRDLLPEHVLARQRMIETIRKVYESYGFVPLETPAVEYEDVLLGPAGEEAARSIFKVTNPEDERLGLRFDLTVPLARVVAQYPELPRPFRRYQVASVWRADKPGPGRFREFTQFDLDAVGVETEMADTEILAAMCDTLTALLGRQAYLVRFSSRRVLNLLLDFAEIPRERSTDVFRVLDKLDKIGIEKLRLELTSGYTDESGAPVVGLGLAASQVERIERFLAIRSERRDEVLAMLRETFAAVPGAGAEIDVLQRMSSDLAALGYGSDRVAIDLSIARGLAYYTGPVFEAVISDAPQFGSVFGGGRYDDLVTRFLGERVPATGASIGVDRLLAALLHMGELKLRRSTAEVLVASLDPALASDCLKLAAELRSAGIRTELYMGMAKGLGKQIRYADQCDVPVVALYGPGERDRGVVALKDMAVGRVRSGQVADRNQWKAERPGQREVARADLVAAVRALLAEIAGPEASGARGGGGGPGGIASEASGPPGSE